MSPIRKIAQAHVKKPFSLEWALQKFTSVWVLGRKEHTPMQIMSHFLTKRGLISLLALQFTPPWARHLTSGLVFILQTWSLRRGLDKGEDKVEPDWKVAVAASSVIHPHIPSREYQTALVKMSCRPDSIRSPLCVSAFCLKNTHTHTHTGYACHQLH